MTNDQNQTLLRFTFRVEHSSRNVNPKAKFGFGHWGCPQLLGISFVACGRTALLSRPECGQTAQESHPTAEIPKSCGQPSLVIGISAVRVALQRCTRSRQGCYSAV